MPCRLVALTRRRKSSSVPRSGLIDLWPPSSEPMAQGLPTSLRVPLTVLFRPFRKARPMGWIGGR